MQFNKVLFVSWHNNQLDSGLYALSALATYIRPYAEVRVVDGKLQDLFGIIDQFHPDLICMPSYTVYHKEVVERAKEVKNHIPVKLLIGGYHITSMPSSFQNPPFDYAILGEGEEALKKLILGETDICGLITQPCDIATLPVVDLPRLTNRDFYRNGAVGMVSSRGCYFNCEYCAIRSMSRGVRFRPIEVVIDEIELYYKELGICHIIFWDDVFGVNTEWLTEFIATLEQRKLLGRLTYDIHVRASTVTQKRCELWKKMGVICWNMGLDFGDDAMLARVKGGGSTVQKNKEAVLLGGEYGFRIGASVIFGAPEEKFEQMVNTLRFLQWYGDQKFTEKIHPHSGIWFFICTPLPGTKWWTWGIEHKRFDLSIDLDKLSLHNWKDHLLLDESVSEEQLDWIHEEAKKHMIRINGSFTEY
jgi:radical SAM superfamily enzyme YgiQ (UPF0313 family)